jgi:hypothetical protein
MMKVKVKLLNLFTFTLEEARVLSVVKYFGSLDLYVL